MQPPTHIPTDACPPACPTTHYTTHLERISPSNNVTHDETPTSIIQTEEGRMTPHHHHRRQRATLDFDLVLREISPSVEITYSYSVFFTPLACFKWGSAIPFVEGQMRA